MDSLRESHDRVRRSAARAWMVSCPWLCRHRVVRCRHRWEAVGASEMEGARGTDAAQPRRYADAGVNIAAGEETVTLMRAAVEASRTPAVVSRLGAFGAAVRSPGPGTL